MGSRPAVEAETSGKFGYLLTWLRERTPEEKRLLLIGAGIINEDGTLTEHYLPKK